MEQLLGLLGGQGHAGPSRRRVPLVSSVSKKKKVKLSWWDRIVNMPVLLVYSYLWKNNKRQLFTSLFFNYIYPLVLDGLPFFYLSQRRLAQELRQTKTNITTRMVQSAPLAGGLLRDYAAFTILYALLSTFRFQVQQRMAQQQIGLVKRMVMEKILHSEIGELDQIAGDGAASLEARVMQDINKTMHLVTFVLPTITGALYTLYQEGSLLFKIRHRIDPLVLMRPVIVGLAMQASESLKYRLWDKWEKKLIKQNERESSQLLQGVSEGLAEIQVNGIQGSQLEAHDMLSAHEIESKHGLNVYTTKVLNTLTNRSLLDYISEVWVVHRTMKNKHLSYAQYSRISTDVAHVVRLAIKIARNMSTGFNAIRNQSKIIRLLKIPNFLNEDHVLCKEVLPFKRITVHNICFRYPQHDPELPANPAALDFQAELSFEAGVSYALLGRNGCGKSTLLQLVCKLQHKVERGCLSLNGMAYSTVSRTALRGLISYVSQRPYIFPGTIYENIVVASPGATYKEVLEAASAAGLFSVDTDQVHSDRPAFKCDCHRSFHLGSSLLPCPKQGLRTPRREKLNKVGCHNCLSGKLLPASRYQPAADLDGRIEQRNATLERETGVRGSLLSGGIMQSVALARIFLRKSASIVILDEAFGQMDSVKKREVILPKLLRFVRAHGMTLILVTHEVETVSYTHLTLPTKRIV
eukprot:TRINITY_DN3191_c0_g1_i6.p1 TRINITY_DN3191_c0_g1~~TRINITY_DN3191_c0_g1_i6.p1  ORF type:complete len:693 (-),score=164.64 TRINITY_DN3191_c0_g1_i6:115-2193(-)